MGQPKLRIFAGPNGSGKSTLFEKIKLYYQTGVFVNADSIEKQIREHGFINLSDYNILTANDSFQRFLSLPHSLSLIAKSKAKNLPISLDFSENILVNRTKQANSYEAALVASFIKQELRESGQTYSYETVFSHQSKLDEIINALSLNYKVYLYFVCIDDYEINLERVKTRVEKGGHFVLPESIISRYTKSLDNLLPALRIAHRSFLFDNSDIENKLIAASENGELQILSENLPNWFIKYVVNRIS